MTVKIFCHTQVEKGTRAYPKLVMKNRTKIKACFLLTTSYRLLAQHLKDGVIFQDDEVPSQIAQDYVMTQDSEADGVPGFALRVVEDAWRCIADCPQNLLVYWIGDSTQKTCPKFKKSDVLVLFQAEYAWRSTFYILFNPFPAGLESRLGKGTKYRMLCTHLLTPSDQPQEQANARPQRWSKINSYRYCWCRTRPRNCWILAREKAQRLARQGCQSCPPVFHWGFQLRHAVPA